MEKEVLEHVKESYRNDVQGARIEEGVVDKNVIDEVKKVCQEKRHMDVIYFQYDEEDGPYRPTWVDVEGEGYGWIWMKEENDSSKWKGILEEEMERDLKRKEEEGLGEVYIKVVTEDAVAYHFIEREREDRDVVYRFFNEDVWNIKI